MTDQRRKKPGQRARQIDALFVAIAATIAILGVFAREAPANPLAPSRQKNIVYVESNDPNGNAIFAFSRGNDGRLTPCPARRSRRGARASRRRSLWAPSTRTRR